MIEELPDNDAFAAQLASLKPATASIDPRDVFYRAGFAAGRASLQTTLRKQLTLAVAASVLLTGISATILYRVGSVVRIGQLPLAKSTSSDALVVEKPATIPASEGATDLTAEAADIRALTNPAAITQGTPESVWTWWIGLAQSIQPAVAANASANSFPSAYRLGLTTDDWSRFAEIPRPFAPPSEDIEFVPTLDDSPLSPRDSLRLRSSVLFPWL